jgi:rhizosphere induced protein
MPNSYSLTVINNSELQSPTFAVFAKLPVSSDFNSLNLAWLTQQINANNHYVFTWDLTWGFAWAAQGTEAGYQWAGGGTLPADPNSTTDSKAEFSYNGDFQLVPAPSTPTGDKLWIVDSATVPLPTKNPSSVAVTLGGSTACVTNAGPNLFQTFTLHPTYYIDAGDYVKGQMVDGDSVTAFQELEFSGGSTALTATLNEDNTWTVGNSSEVDFSARLGGRNVVGNGEWPPLPADKSKRPTDSGIGYSKRNGKGDENRNVTIAQAIKDGDKSWAENASTGRKYNLTGA